MEPTQAKIRKITAVWHIDSWYIRDGFVYTLFNGVTLGFDMTACGFTDWLKPDQQLNLVLEIPCPPSPNTNPTPKEST